MQKRVKDGRRRATHRNESFHFDFKGVVFADGLLHGRLAHRDGQNLHSRSLSNRQHGSETRQARERKPCQANKQNKVALLTFTTRSADCSTTFMSTAAPDIFRGNRGGWEQIVVGLQPGGLA